MVLIWLGILTFSLAWFLLTGFYYPTTIHYSTPYIVIFSLLISGTIINIFALRTSNIDFEKADKKYLLFLIPLSLLIYTIPFPYNLAPVFGIAGLILFPFLRIGKLRQVIVKGILFSAIILSVQTFVIPFFFLLFSHFHRVDWLTSPILILLKITGVDCAVSQNQLFIGNFDKVFSFITGWDMLALFVFLQIMAGGIIAILFFSREIDNGNRRSFSKTRTMISFFLVLFVYMIFRYAAILFTFLNMEKANVFWRFDILFISFIPLPFLLKKFIKCKRAISFSLPPFVLNRKVFFISFLSVLMSFSLIGFWGFHDPGIQKQGRILIDEGHSNWEWTTRKFDTQWYGKQSAYNYYCLANYLDHFYHVRQSDSAITENLLANTDILIIKTPTEPFTQNEIQAIKRFVSKGGGLFLIGDHTNVFGITTNLNPIARQFGLNFRYDGQYDISGELSVYHPPKILPHPVVQNIPVFLFETGCTIAAPLSSDCVMTGYGIKSIYLDYSRKNFFPANAFNEETMEFGLFLQSAGTTFGKGRVLLFTDSTVWSNFSMFIPGKPELLLGCIEWLNRKNSVYYPVKWIFPVFGFIFLLCILILRLKWPLINLSGLPLFASLLTIALTIPFFEFLNRVQYAAPEPHTKYTQINFEYEHSSYELPIQHLVRNHRRSLSTFYTWIQRMGFVPKVCYKFSDALKDGDALVIANPQKEFSESEVRHFTGFIKNGGKALIIADPQTNSISVVNRLLNNTDMQVATIPAKYRAAFYRTGQKDSLLFVAAAAGCVNGGTNLLKAVPRPNNEQRNAFPSYRRGNVNPHLPQNDFPVPANDSHVAESKELRNETTTANGKNYENVPVFSVEKFGKGILAVMACFDVFSNDQMGYSFTIPNKNINNIYETEYWIFRELFGLKE